MEPITGFILYAIAVVVVGVIASKRGRSGWGFGLSCLLLGPVVVMIVGAVSGNGVAAAVLAFMVPVAAVVVILSMPTSEQAAVIDGQHGAFRKCPFCAESVRVEAVKCKHCGSDLATSNPSA